MRKIGFIVGLLSSTGCGLSSGEHCTEVSRFGSPSLPLAASLELKGTVPLPKSGDSLRSLDIADLDGNGSPDLVIGRGNTVVWLRGTEVPMRFGGPTLLATIPEWSGRGLTLGDVDADLRDELILWDNDSIRVMPAGEAVPPDDVYWFSDFGITDIDFSAADREMVVSGDGTQTVLDVSSDPPREVLEVSLARPVQAGHLVDLDGRPPLDLLAVTDAGTTVTFRDRGVVTTGVMVEVPTAVVSLRTRWSDRTLVTMPEDGDEAVWARAQEDEGYGAAQVWAWAEGRLVSIGGMDVNGDGYDELLLHYRGLTALAEFQSDGTLRVIGRIGQMNPRDPWDLPGAVTRDLDGNGFAEIVLIGPDNTLEVFGTSSPVLKGASCSMPQLPVPAGSRIVPE